MKAKQTPYDIGVIAGRIAARRYTRKPLYARAEDAVFHMGFFTDEDDLDFCAGYKSAFLQTRRAANRVK